MQVKNTITLSYGISNIIIITMTIYLIYLLYHLIKHLLKLIYFNNYNIELLV